ncbi:MAG TPA: tetraacyldisaccharide 4'-kinase [Syntrophales bacterium]|nr:tetraacyldisaccharide 4'-kinase [Syntrophales bacterium]
MHPQAVLEGIWYRPGAQARRHPLFWPLYALSLPYGAAIGLRNRLYNGGGLPRTKLPCPVISVGNLTVGGTGKTPLVMLLAELMQEAGRRPAILSRGFGGRSSRGVQVVSDGRRLLAAPETAGDEPVLMARTLPSVPVLAGPDRVRTGRAALDRFGATLLILDDAFQHRRLVRDLDIVLADLALPFGNGCLLPAGPLREPVQALRRARIVIRTGSEAEARTTPASADAGGLRGFHRPRELVRGDGAERHPPAMLAGKRLLAFAGLGRPDAFRKTLAALGAEVAVFLPFPDHHDYRRTDIEDIRRRAAAAKAELIVTTEKDAVRLAPCPDFLGEVFQLRVVMDILPARETLAARVLERIAP